MDPLRWKRITELFSAARLLQGERQIAFLKENCGQDQDLFEQLKSLLDVDYQQDLLDSKSIASKLDIPKIVADRFRIVHYIAAGGMGVVYKAEDTDLGRFVALKFLSDDLAFDPLALDRFKREARAASALNHPNICTIHEIGTYQERPFIVMEFLDGMSLKDRIGNQPLDIALILDLGYQIADGLDAAHGEGIIHRDIKSANIFCTRHGHIKILDFGLAKVSLAAVATASSAFDVPYRGEQTSPGIVAGTLAYMSPEQLKGEQLDSRTDLFSFGAVLYEMATGRTPFAGSTAHIRTGILSAEPQPVSRTNANISPELERIIRKALQKDRSLRYQKASEIRDDIQRIRRKTENRPKEMFIALIVAVLAAALITAGVTYLGRDRESKFHEKDTVVLADFHNQTGESGWDDTLKLALTNELENSKYLNVLPDQKVSETLKMMKHKPDEILTTELATQVCLRNSNKAFLTASIAKVGEGYHLDLRAINCVTGAMLASADADADNKEKVITALKLASNELRQNLGESLASVEKYSTPLPQVTSASLDALQDYARGLKIKAAQGSAAAVPFYKRSIELDPDLADAYAALGAAYSDMGEDTLSMENSRKAYELREHVSSQREKLHIEGDYYDSVTGDTEKANQTYLEWIQVYPDDHRPHQNLGSNYAEMGQFDKAIEQEEVVMQLQPHNVNGFASLMGDYLALDQPDKVRDIFEQAHSLKLDNKYLGLYRYYAAFLQGDVATMQKEIEWSVGRPGAEDALLSAQSDTEAFYGRFDRARNLTQRAAQSAKNADMTETAAEWMANAAMREAEVGNRTQARITANEAMAVSGGIDVELQVALALARAGQLAQAEKIVVKLDAECPRNTMVQNYWLPTIRAAIELQNGDPNKALELLEQTIPYELGNWYVGHLYPAYLRGEAYLKLGRGQEATEEFQKILDHRGVVLNFVTGSLAYLQLGRAAAVRSDTASARKEYEGFLGLWKNADANLPVLKVAQGEYQRLPK